MITLIRKFLIKQCMVRNNILEIFLRNLEKISLNKKGSLFVFKLKLIKNKNR